MPEPTIATSVREGGAWRAFCSCGAARHQNGSKEAFALKTLLPNAMSGAFPKRRSSILSFSCMYQ